MPEQPLFQNLFLSVGAMKAGTTWLYSVLSRNPALHFAMEKEIHYFYHQYVNPEQLSETYRLQAAQTRYLGKFDPDRANIDRVRADTGWVSAYLSRPVDDYWYRNLFHLRDHETYACDFSNLNAQVPKDAWRQIAQKCGRLRILFTMRDPVKRLWSHTKFHLEVTGQLDKLDTWGPSEFGEFIQRPHMWVNMEYGQILRSLRGGLNENMLHVLFYEELHQDQRGTLASLEDFLGVPRIDYPQALLDRRLTESVKRPMPAFFFGLVEEDVDRICREVEAEGYNVPESWHVTQAVSA